MDPRQRSVNRRRTLRIRFLLLVGALLLGVGLLLAQMTDGDSSDGLRRRDPAIAFLVAGGVLLVAGVFEVGSRLLKGPQKPGRHAAD